MPPRGGPESSPPRQGAPNLLLSIVPRRYDTSHHAGGPTQSATGSSASSIRVGRESNSVWGESSGCSRTTNLFTSSTRLVSQQASPPAFVRIPAVRRSAAAAQGMPTTGAFLFRSGSGAGSVDSLPNPLLLPDNASPTLGQVEPCNYACFELLHFDFETSLETLFDGPLDISFQSLNLSKCALNLKPSKQAQKLASTCPSAAPEDAQAVERSGGEDTRAHAGWAGRQRLRGRAQSTCSRGPGAAS